MPAQFDAAIIGTGQAGPSLADRLSRAGLKVAVIERANFGGTCVNTGCMPTKTLVASAYAAHVAARGVEYGLRIDGRIGVDWKKIIARKNMVSGTARKNIETWLRSMKGCTVYRGHARLTSPNEIQIGTENISAHRIFLNVGGRAMVPPIPGIEQVGALTNQTVMDLEALPSHLIILGGSYIGLEFAQIFRRFGSAVTVIEAAPRLVPREDDDVSNAIKDILEQEGIVFHLGSKCSSLEKRGDDVIAHVDSAAGAAKITGSHVLVAIGRRPNTDDLGLEAVGVRVEQGGIVPTDDFLRTNIASIWALGDCNGRGAFTHTSYNDFEIVAANILDNDPRRVTDRITTYGLFIDPPLGRIGMTEREAKATGRRMLVGRRAMTRVGRAIEKGETQGFIKVLVDAETRKVAGACILGTSGDEAIHCISTLMYADAPYTTLQRSVLIHPTVSELIPTVLGSLEPL